MSACCPPPGWHPLPPTPVALPTRPVPRRGAHDRVIPVRTQEQGSTATPGSWLVSLPDAGHVVPYQHPLQWAQQVLRFLDTAKEVGAALRCAITVARCVLCQLSCQLLGGATATAAAHLQCCCSLAQLLKSAVSERFYVSRLAACSAARATGASSCAAAAPAAGAERRRADAGRGACPNTTAQRNV